MAGDSPLPRSTSAAAVAGRPLEDDLHARDFDLLVDGLRQGVRVFDAPRPPVGDDAVLHGREVDAESDVAAFDVDAHAGRLEGPPAGIVL